MADGSRYGLFDRLPDEILRIIVDQLATKDLVALSYTTRDASAYFLREALVTRHLCQSDKRASNERYRVESRLYHLAWENRTYKARRMLKRKIAIMRDRYGFLKDEIPGHVDSFVSSFKTQAFYYSFHSFEGRFFVLLYGVLVQVIDHYSGLPLLALELDKPISAYGQQCSLHEINSTLMIINRDPLMLGPHLRVRVLGFDLAFVTTLCAPIGLGEEVLRLHSSLAQTPGVDPVSRMMVFWEDAIELKQKHDCEWELSPSLNDSSGAKIDAFLRPCSNAGRLGLIETFQVGPLGRLDARACQKVISDIVFVATAPLSSSCYLVITKQAVPGCSSRSTRVMLLSAD